MVMMMAEALLEVMRQQSCLNVVIVNAMLILATMMPDF